MYDKELTLEVLEQIRTASQTILDRFKPAKAISDFPLAPDLVGGLVVLFSPPIYSAGWICRKKYRPELA
jgi:hypothetical protein